MDIEKLIERLYKHHTDWGEGRTQDFFEVCLDCKDAATALSTLRAENDELRAELENYRKGHCSEGGCAAEKDRDLMIAEVERLRAELEQVKAERDAAVKAIERVRSCKDCGHYTGEWTPPCKECQDSEEHHPYFKWHGQKED